MPASDRPAAVTLRTDLDALLERGAHRDVRAELSAAALRQLDAVTCHRVASHVDRLDAAACGLHPVRVAVLTNYTAAPLVPFLKTQALPSGLQVSVYQPGFDQWMPELLDEGSGLRRFNPDVVVFDLLLDPIAPAFTRAFLSLDGAAVERAITDVTDAIATALHTLRTWSKARALVHLPARPVAPSLGILDADVQGQKSAFDRLHAAIRNACKGQDAYCIDTDRLIADVGIANWRDARMWEMAKVPYATAAWRRIADEQVRYLRALTGRVRKVLVLDLDDTLWGGVLGEAGEHGLALGDTYPGSGFVKFQQAVAELRRRGVVLALNSSNDERDALDVIQRHPAMVLRQGDFAAWRINWNDKARNMTELADELNLGLDSFVFIDNSDAECARLRQALPEVMTLQLSGEPAGFADWLLQLGVFDALGYTEEDRKRADMYRGEVQRARHRDSIGSMDDYLASLEMVLSVERVSAQSLARAADLTQRTNQFNMTTRRRTAAEIEQWLAGTDHDALVFSLQDRFGAQGIIGFAALRHDGAAAEITDFLISCRVLKRTVEFAMLGAVVAHARERGATRVIAEYRKSARNAPFGDFYASAGMRQYEGDETVVRYELESALPMPPHVAIRKPSVVSQ
jgi:FkbH-like protein